MECVHFKDCYFYEIAVYNRFTTLIFRLNKGIFALKIKKNQFIFIMLCIKNVNSHSEKRKLMLPSVWRYNKTAFFEMISNIIIARIV